MAVPGDAAQHSAAEFRILGPLEVVSINGPMELRGSKRRALLAMLLVKANHVISADRLIDDLWEERPPDSARATLQTYVSQLRKALALSALHTRPGGYMLEVDEASLDATRFESSVRAVQAQGAEPPEQAATKLAESLRWWRGPALGEFDRMPWARPEIARLDGLRFAAIEQLADARLALGEHATIIDELEVLVREYPLRERLWGQLMVALYRSGRQADALRAYGRLRTHLGEELGIEPSKTLVQLESSILRQEPELDWPVPHLMSAPGSPSDPRSEATSPVLPPVVRALAADVFVGRANELETLERAWNRGARGERQAVLIDGDAGIGKTRLVAELSVRVAADGGTVLYGRCDDELGVPYQPWIEAFEGFVRARGATGPAGAAYRGGGIAWLLPQLVTLVGGVQNPVGDDADTERSLVFAAVVDVLARIAAEHPVVLILEDLHWADPPTLALLRRVLRSSSGQRMLVVGTYRASELATEDPLDRFLVGMHREVGIQREHLDGFGDTETEVLLELALGESLGANDRTLARSLRRETGGNAFFTKEIIQELVADRNDPGPDASVPWARTPGRGLPQSVRSVLAHRVRRLGDDGADQLTVASVLGHQFDLETLAAVVDRPEDEVLIGLEVAQRAGLLAEVDGQPGRFAFSHSLVEQALYTDLSATRRQRLHRRAVDALELLQAGDPQPRRVRELAHHWVSGSMSPADAGAALRATRAAAADALANFAPEDAVRWYQHSLDLAGWAGADETLRCDLLIGLGTSQLRAGDLEASRATLVAAAAAAEQLGDTDLLVKAALGNTQALFTPMAAVDDDRIRLLETALSALGPASTSTRAELLATLAAELMWSADIGRRTALVTEALTIAQTIGEPRALVRVLDLSFHTLYLPDNIPQRTAWAEEALVAADAAADPVLRWTALNMRTWVAYDAGELTVLDHHLEEQAALGERLGEPHRLVGAAMLRAVRTATGGPPEDAETALAELLEIGSTTDLQTALPIWGALRLTIGFRRGEAAELVAMIEQSTQPHRDIAAVQSALALAYVELGRDIEARAILDVEAQAGFKLAPYDRQWLSHTTRCALVAAELGDQASAAALAPILEPFADLAVGALAGPGEGPIAYHLGRLAMTLHQHDAALAHFQRAELVNERVDVDYWRACTSYHRARCLYSRSHTGDAAQADAELERAAVLSHRNEYAHLERRIGDLRSELAKQ